MKTHRFGVALALIPLASFLAACGGSSTGDTDAEAGSPSGVAGALPSAGSGPVAAGGSGAGESPVGTAGAEQGGTGGVAVGGEGGLPGEAGSTQSAGSGGAAGAAGLDPSKTPGENFDLSRFTLQLPTGTTDAIDQVKAVDLVKYTSIYFYTDKTDGAMTFWCPDNGVHTAHTEYARTELRENAVGGDWQISATASLSATFEVTKLPKTKSVIVGQIHGNATDGTGEALKLEYGADNAITAVFEKNASPSSEDPKDLGKYALGQKLSYTIAIANKVLTVTITDANGVKKTASTTYSAASWTKDTYYFKLGDYNQENTGGSTDGGRVAFYAFNIDHG